MKKVLVTGASGWLGQAVVSALARRGDTVIAVDLFVSPGLKHEAQQNPRIIPVIGDLTEWGGVLGIFEAHTLDAVVHCAAIVGVVAAEDFPLKALRVNVEGAINLLEVMRHCGVKRVVHLSTEETYGDFTQAVIDEEHPQHPTSVYGATKLQAEQFGRLYHRRYGIEWINVRTCWVYGPALPRARVPKIFIDAAVQGTPLVLESGGDLAVDQVYISDTVQGVLLALDKAEHRYDSYNIATGVAPTINDVAQIVRRLNPTADIQVKSGPYYHGDRFLTAKKGALCIDRARAELGYAPQYTIERGITEIYEIALKEYRQPQP